MLYPQALQQKLPLDQALEDGEKNPSPLPWSPQGSGEKGHGPYRADHSPRAERNRREEVTSNYSEKRDKVHSDHLLPSLGAPRCQAQSLAWRAAVGRTGSNG